MLPFSPASALKNLALNSSETTIPATP
jgi:hypothetical protein